MHLIPIPTTAEHLGRTANIWLPFLERVAVHSDETMQELVSQVVNFQVRLVLVWDGEKAHALGGIRVVQMGDQLVGDVVWWTGEDREQWQDLLPELERMLKQHGCTKCRPIARPGWKKLLQANGYKMTHVMMEKAL